MTIQVIPSGNGTTSGPTTQAATANITSETIDTDNKGLKVGTLSVTAVTTGFNAADATVRLQHSNDNVTFENIDLNDSTVGLMTLASGAATKSLTPVTYLAMRYYRVVYTKNSNSAGTIQVLVNLL